MFGRRKKNPGWQAREVLDAKPIDRAGRRIINEAIQLSYQYPLLSPGELIRLAYWGASGEPDPEWRKHLKES